MVKELLRGYRLKGKVARHSRVLIGECALVEDEPTVPAPEPSVPAAEAEPAPPADAVSDDDEELVPLLGESELSLEEIIARAEAQDALFPAPEPEPELPPAAEPVPAPEKQAEAKTEPIAILPPSEPAAEPSPEPPAAAAPVPVAAPALPDVPDAGEDSEVTFTLPEEAFDKRDTHPIVFPDVDADTLAAALADEGWPEGLELPGLEESPRGDKKRGKR